MSLASRVADLATAIATDIKQHRTWMTGSSSGTLASLTTTDKTSLIAAINETKAGNSGSPPDASESVKGIVELATTTEATTGTDTVRAVTPAGVKAAVDAMKATILGGAGAAFDTLEELRVLIAAAEETSVIDALTTVVGNKADISTIYTRTEIGNPETDFAATYAAAKA